MELTFILAGATREELLLEFMQEFYACEHLTFDELAARRAETYI